MEMAAELVWEDDVAFFFFFSFVEPGGKGVPDIGREQQQCL